MSEHYIVCGWGAQQLHRPPLFILRGPARAGW